MPAKRACPRSSARPPARLRARPRLRAPETAASRRSAPKFQSELMFDYVLKKIVGTKNQRELKKMQPVVARINEREAWAKSLSDEQIREQVQAWRKEIADKPNKEKSEVLDRILPDCFALTRE